MEPGLTIIRTLHQRIQFHSMVLTLEPEEPLGSREVHTLRTEALSIQHLPTLSALLSLSLQETQ